MRSIIRLTLALTLCGSMAAGSTAPAYILDAIAAQKTLSLQNPGDVELLNDLGNLLVMADRFAEAEDAYRRAVGLAPTQTSIRYNLALVLMEQNETKLAVEELKTVLEMDPHHAWAHYQLGTLEARRDNRIRALHHYERAFALDWDLISPIVNPHIVENRLATDAMLRAYMSQSPASIAPRIYHQPDQVAERLVPGPAEIEARESESDAMGFSQDADTTTGLEGTGSVSSPETEGDRVLTESDLQGRSVSASEPTQPKRRNKPRRNRSSSTSVEPTESVASDSQAAPTREPTRSPTRQPRSVGGFGVTSVGTTPVGSDSETSVQPGTSSTGRMDLEVIGRPDRAFDDTKT